MTSHFIKRWRHTSQWCHIYLVKTSHSSHDDVTFINNSRLILQQWGHTFQTVTSYTSMMLSLWNHKVTFVTQWRQIVQQRRHPHEATKPQFPTILSHLSYDVVALSNDDVTLLNRRCHTRQRGYLYEVTTSHSSHNGGVTLFNIDVILMNLQRHIFQRWRHIIQRWIKLYINKNYVTLFNDNVTEWRHTPQTIVSLKEARPSETWTTRTRSAHQTMTTRHPKASGYAVLMQSRYDLTKWFLWSYKSVIESVAVAVLDGGLMASTTSSNWFSSFWYSCRLL